MAIKSIIMGALNAPRCAREIADAFDLRTKSVQTALRRLEAKGMIRCVTPSLKQTRLYLVSLCINARSQSLAMDRQQLDQGPDLTRHVRFHGVDPVLGNGTDRVGLGRLGAAALEPGYRG